MATDVGQVDVKPLDADQCAEPTPGAQGATACVPRQGVAAQAHQLAAMGWASPC
jgi:hypothetical protein